MMGGAPRSGDTAGTRLRVLERTDGYAKVRDEQGNDGWVPTDAL